jgi:hypothetical protein
MKCILKVVASSTLLLFLGCGTETPEEINPNRGFDMWEYMTSTLNYEIEYDIYENSKKVDYYIETDRVLEEGSVYERRSNSGKTMLFLNGNSILMREPSRDIDIKRYVNLKTSDVFRSSSIDSCIVDEFYKTITIKDSDFTNVLMISCWSKSAVKQEFYYGYNEGLVALYEKDQNEVKEYVKVSEKRIF